MGPELGADHRRLRADALRPGGIGVVVERMVLEPAAHRQVGKQRDRQRLQLVGRADTGAQQDRRAAVGAGAEDHFAGVDFLAGGQAHAHRALAFEEHPVDQRVAADRQVGASAHGVVEVGHAGVDAHTVDDIHRVRPDAVGVGAVEIGDGLETVGQGGVDEGPLHRREIGAAQLPHRQRSVPAVQGRVAALAGLQAAERRQQVVVGPARQVPAGEVFAPRADRHRAVDRRAAAEDLAADRMDRVPDRPRLGLVAPVAGGVAADAVAAGDDPGVVPGRIGLAGFQQQYPAVAALAQAPGEDRAGGAAADDQHIDPAAIEGLAGRFRRGAGHAGRAAEQRAQGERGGAGDGLRQQGAARRVFGLVHGVLPYPDRLTGATLCPARPRRQTAEGEPLVRFFRTQPGSNRPRSMSARSQGAGSPISSSRNWPRTRIFRGVRWVLR